MLSILRVVDQHRSTAVNMIGNIDKDSFKIIYVLVNSAATFDSPFDNIFSAPMKALASEIVRKLGKRLQWLSIQVKELTGVDQWFLWVLTFDEVAVPGDMQLTKNEIIDTQIIVTTPEKWDVVTRKPTGEGELASVLWSYLVP
jgi:antiviral helicase SLH1